MFYAEHGLLNPDAFCGKGVRKAWVVS